MTYLAQHAFCFLAAIATAGQPARAQAASLDAEKLFDPSHLVEVQIELDSEDWNRIRRQTRAFATSLGKTPAESPFDYVEGKATIDGVRFERVAVRKKGFVGSLDTTRPSLKLKILGPDKPADGTLDRLTLNNNKQDRSLLSQHLTNMLFQKAGVAAPRSNHARVSVNGTSLGIYTNVESMREPMLRRVFGDASGELFEGTVADLFEDTLEKFEPKNRRSDPKSLRALARLLRPQSPLDLEAVARHLDLDAFLRFWALESITGLWDGYTNNQNNYFIYKHAKNAKLYFLPWGTDSAFTNAMPIPPYRIKTRAAHSVALLPNRLYRLEAIQTRYLEALESLLSDHWDETRLNAEIDRVVALVGDKLHESQGDFVTATQSVRKFIKSRRRVLARDLRKWPLQLTEGPRRPFYFRRLGEATGSFSTTWNEASPRRPLEHGEATLELVLEGQPVKFSKLGVSGERSKIPTADGSPLPPVIVFTGQRADNGERIVLGFGTDGDRFAPSGKTPILVQGIFFQGAISFDAQGFKMVAGSASIEAASTTTGAPVRGTMRVEIFVSAGHEHVEVK